MQEAAQSLPLPLTAQISAGHDLHFAVCEMCAHLLPQVDRGGVGSGR